MGKKSRIFLIIAVSVLGLAYGLFLFLLPTLINPGNYSREIKTAVKGACGLDIEPGTLKLRTYPDLSAGITAENTQVLIPASKTPSLKVAKAGVKVRLLPLLFKKLEFAEVYVNNPEISLTKQKDGKYDIEKAIKIPEQPNQEDVVAQEEKKNTDIKLVFDGIDIIVRNYKVNLTDISGGKPQSALLKGDLIRISDFQPDKFVKVATKGQFLVGDEPRITYDVTFSDEVSPELDEGSIEPPAENVEMGGFDPLEGLLKYSLKGDIKADLKVKTGKISANNAYIKGFLNIDKLSLMIDGKRLPDSYGKFKFSGKKLDIDSKLFITPAAFLAVSGNINDIAKQDLDLNVKSSDIRLNDVKKFAYSLADAVNADISMLSDIGLGGSVKADFDVKKNNYQGYLTLKNVQVSHKGISQPLKNLNGSLKFDKNKVLFENTSGYLGDVKFDVLGDVSSKSVADVKIIAPAVNCATAYGIVNNSKLFADIKQQIKDVNSVSGLISAEIYIKGDLNKEFLPDIRLSANNVHANYVPSKLPITIVKGSIVTDTKNTKLKSLSIVVANSPVKVKGEISDKKGVQDINVTLDGKVMNSDIGKYLGADAQKSLKPNANLPFDAVITGKPEDLKVVAQVDVDKLTPGVKISQPKGSSGVLSINANVKPTSIILNESGFYTAMNSSKAKGKFDLASASRLIAIEGGISGTNTKNPLLDNIKVDISGLNVGLMEPRGSLQVGGNLVVSGRANAPKVLGALSLKGMTIPSMKMLVKEVNLTLKNDEILANTDIIDVAGSDFVVSAVLENKLAPPFKVKSAKVTSNFVNLDKLSVVMQAASKPATSRRRVSRASTGSYAPSVPQDVPVLINSGTFSAQRLITCNLPVQSVTADFAIKSINELDVRNIQARTAGGAITGTADTNLKTTRLNMDIAANDVEINDLATEMANMPGEVHGKADGQVKLETIGQTPEETTQNAVGTMNFEVKNGRLTKLGSIQYLLGAKNLSLKGVTEGLIQKTLGFAEAEQTNHFDALNGRININRGVLYIEELRMHGKYLSSYTTGTIKMKTSNADLVILNRLSGRIVRRLGPVAAVPDLTVDTLVKKIPGKWGQLLSEDVMPAVSNVRGIRADKYPNRNKIPALNADSLPEDRDFAVKIKGNLNKPFAVKSFEWLPVLAQPQAGTSN